jgi:hypothetical protein
MNGGEGKELYMQELPQPLFDVYALALPRGHGFGRQPPVGAWQSDEGLACGVVTRRPSKLPFSSMVSAHSALIQGHDGTVLLQQPELFAGRLSLNRIGEREGVNAIESALFDQINWPYLQILIRE